jgi:hypothetical protein
MKFANESLGLRAWKFCVFDDGPRKNPGSVKSGDGNASATHFR